MVINDFVNAMMGKDHKALAACFTDRCRFIDYCPTIAGRHGTFLYGKNAIEMFFHNKFMFGAFTMLDPRITSERVVNFYVDYSGTMVHALAEIEDCTEGDCALDSSLIKELVIRPA